MYIESIFELLEDGIFIIAGNEDKNILIGWDGLFGFYAYDVEMGLFNSMEYDDYDIPRLSMAKIIALEWIDKIVSFEERNEE